MEFFGKKTNFRFMEKRRYWYAISVFLIVGTFVLVAVRGLNFGVDFTGGVVIEAAFPQAADTERTRAALEAAGIAGAQVQTFGTASELLVRLPPAEARGTQELIERASEALATVSPGVEIRRTEAVGPQVGKELAEKGATALLMALLFIGLYVVMRFQWKLSLGAMAATMHDPILIVGFFALTQMTFDLSALAAILAVIGYSVNDTVVVFDRVRERMVQMRKATPAEIMNVAVNETLSRTIMTGVTTLLVVLSLLFFGGEALRSFSATLAVGIVLGVYSTIYIAGAVALDLGLSQRDLMPIEKKQEADGLP
jgi:preprotein translocase subunit SecF